MYQIFSFIGIFLLAIILYWFLWKFYQFEKKNIEKN